MGRRASAWWLSVACGCSSFTGSTTRPLDAPATDAPAATDHAAPDARVSVGVFCGYEFACHPVTQVGCGADEACVVDSIRPPRAHCERDSARAEGASCIAGMPPCGRGTQCINGTCARFCCYESVGPDPCAAPDAGVSTCAVLTEGMFLRGCTLPGACDYRAPSGCDAGQACFPQSEFGRALCRRLGTAAPEGRCVDQADCVAGYTCRIPPGLPFGRCARVCNPERPGLAGCECSLLADRPADFGVCD